LICRKRFSMSFRYRSRSSSFWPRSWSRFDESVAAVICEQNLKRCPKLSDLIALCHLILECGHYLSEEKKCVLYFDWFLDHNSGIKNNRKTYWPKRRIIKSIPGQSEAPGSWDLWRDPLAPRSRLSPRINVMVLKIVSPNFWHFLLKLLLVIAKVWSWHWFLRKNANFFTENWQKLQKIVVIKSTF
jgi:hypothetical protein